MPLPQRLIEQNQNNIFIETGTYDGTGLEKALAFGNFKKLISIEIVEFIFKEAKDKFKLYNQVHLYHGDSVKVLPEILKEINEPITFWLDAHYSGGNTGYGDNYSALYDELEIIADHHIKDHTIMIDDIRAMETKFMDYKTLDKVKEKVLKINSNYQIEIVDSDKHNPQGIYEYYEKDILIAHEKKD